MQRGEDICEVHVLHVATWMFIQSTTKFWQVRYSNASFSETLVPLLQTTWLQSSCPHHDSLTSNYMLMYCHENVKDGCAK